MTPAQVAERPHMCDHLGAVYSLGWVYFPSLILKTNVHHVSKQTFKAVYGNISSVDAIVKSVFPFGRCFRNKIRFCYLHVSIRGIAAGKLEVISAIARCRISFNINVAAG